jgi:dsDNA-specific endonuclease/ATPase MutS2
MRAMAARFTLGEAVQTRFGQGVVREVRNNGCLLVDVEGRALVVTEMEISPLDARRRRSRSEEPGPAYRSVRLDLQNQAPGVPAEVDLHGLSVEEALARTEHALNEALLAGVAELRLIHGRSGGRIRAALHRWLREIPSVRGFRADPRNEGVTIVKL